MNELSFAFKINKWQGAEAAYPTHKVLKVDVRICAKKKKVDYRAPPAWRGGGEARWPRARLSVTSVVSTVVTTSKAAAANSKRRIMVDPQVLVIPQAHELRNPQMQDPAQGEGVWSKSIHNVAL